jgi:hypothetical protein
MDHPTITKELDLVSDFGWVDGLFLKNTGHELAMLG